MRWPNRKIFLFLLALLFLFLPFFSQANGPQSFTGKVVGVSDGDTISVMRKGREIEVRLHGIDCPEMSKQEVLAGLSEIIPDDLWLMDVSRKTTKKQKRQKKGSTAVIEETFLTIVGTMVPAPGRKSLESIAKLIQGLNSLESFQRVFEPATLVRTHLSREKEREIMKFEISNKLKGEAGVGGASTETWKGKVVGVFYGDTISVMYGDWVVMVRLYGIDCPELGQPFGKWSEKFTSNLTLGKEVEVRVRDTDVYGRIMGRY